MRKSIHNSELPDLEIQTPGKCQSLRLFLGRRATVDFRVERSPVFGMVLEHEVEINIGHPRGNPLHYGSRATRKMAGQEQLPEYYFPLTICRQEVAAHHAEIVFRRGIPEGAIIVAVAEIAE